MPALVTHYLFGQRVLAELADKNVQQTIRAHKKVFGLGLQGPDIFCYDVYLLPLDDYRNIGPYMHSNRTKDFFVHCFTIAEEQSDKNTKDIMLAYTYGFLCHYVLDSICHPFVYAHTDFDPENPTRDSYGKHADLENVIDAYCWEKFSNEPLSNFDQSSIFRLCREDCTVISDFLAQALERTYGDLFLGNHFKPRFIRNTLRFARRGSVIITDPYGKKKEKIKKIEDKYIGYNLFSCKFITAQQVDLDDPMNFERKPWRDAWDKQKISDANFLMLFEQSVTAAKKLLDSASSPSATVVMLDNSSYHSGTI